MVDIAVKKVKKKLSTKEKIKLGVEIVTDVGISGIANYILKPVLDELSGFPRVCAKAGMTIIEFMVGDKASDFVMKKLDPYIKEENEGE